MLACTILLASTPASAQLLLPPYTRVTTQSDIGVPCNPPSCTCTVNGASSLSCNWVRNHDSDNHATAQTDDDTAVSIGTFLPFYDSTVTSNLDLHGNADYGTLKALAVSHSDTSGTYVEAGGLAIPATVDAYAQVLFSDVLTVTAPVPGQIVSLGISRNITSTDMVDVGGAGMAIDPCLANGHARTELEASLLVSTNDGTGGGLSQYARDTQTCQTTAIIGAPQDTLVVNVPDGKTATVSGSLTVTAYARQDGGEGGLAHPNRARSADALLDASSTAKLYVEVLTAGATYVSASGTIYAVPEAAASGATAAALASLLAARMRRRS
jgi:hypothetical protein